MKNSFVNKLSLSSALALFLHCSALQASQSGIEEGKNEDQKSTIARMLSSVQYLGSDNFEEGTKKRKRNPEGFKEEAKEPEQKERKVENALAKKSTDIEALVKEARDKLKTLGKKEDPSKEVYYIAEHALDPTVEELKVAIDCAHIDADKSDKIEDYAREAMFLEKLFKIYPEMMFTPDRNYCQNYWWDLIWAYTSLGRFKDALAFYDQHCKERKDLDEGIVVENSLLFADICYQLEDFKRAVAFYDKKFTPNKEERSLFWNVCDYRQAANAYHQIEDFKGEAKIWEAFLDSYGEEVVTDEDYKAAGLAFHKAQKSLSNDKK